MINMFVHVIQESL